MKIIIKPFLLIVDESLIQIHISNLLTSRLNFFIFMIVNTHFSLLISAAQTYCLFDEYF